MQGCNGACAVAIKNKELLLFKVFLCRLLPHLRFSIVISNLLCYTTETVCRALRIFTVISIPQHNMFLSLIVIRSAAMEALVSFYENFGIKWDYHQHGNSPFHYSAKIDKTLVEIYPLSRDQTAIDSHFRLGIAVEKFDEVIDRLKGAGVYFVTASSETGYGISTIVKDPEGRRVEIYKIS